MIRNSEKHAASSRQTEQQSAALDRLLDYREVNHLTGSRCKTAHTARALAARGMIHAVRLNARVVRYTESSVRRLVAGLVDPVAVPRAEGKEVAA